MSERRFMGMVALATLASFMAVASPSAAIFPTLMIFVLGFDAIAGGEK